LNEATDLSRAHLAFYRVTERIKRQQKKPKSWKQSSLKHIHLFRHPSIVESETTRNPHLFTVMRRGYGDEMEVRHADGEMGRESERGRDRSMSKEHLCR
jgi:hypothetical protein